MVVHKLEMANQRNTSVEIFRILSTLLVLIVHFTGWFVGGISDPFDGSIGLPFRIGQTLICSLTIVCVNCFLIISGWYGLKLKFKSIWKMYVLLVCIYIPFQFVTFIYSGNFSFASFCDNLLVFTRENYFVQCYVMLLFLSPIINSFFDKYGRKALVYVLIFWGIEVVMETIRDNKSLGFNDGYSLIHFVLIYMLARIASLYKEQILKIRSRYWIIGYFICAILVCIEHLIGIKHTWAYSNPIVVAESFFIFFPFIYKNYYNKLINWIAGSTFAVYIIHVTPPVYNYLIEVDKWLLVELNYYIYVVCYLFLCVIVFLLCIFYDKCREIVISPLTDKIYEVLNIKLKRFFIYE